MTWAAPGGNATPVPSFNVSSPTPAPLTEPTPVSLGLDLTAGVLSWLLCVLANRFLIHRIDSRVEEAFLSSPTAQVSDPAMVGLSFGTASTGMAASGQTSAITSAMTTPIRNAYDDDPDEVHLLHRVGVFTLIVGDPKCWVYCAAIAVGLIRAIYFFASTALASLSPSDSDQLATFNPVQDAASAPVMAVYYSALLLIGWTIFEGYIPSDYFRSSSACLHRVYQRRIRLSVFTVWLVITVSVLAENLDASRFDARNSPAAYCSAVLSWIGGVFYAFQAVVVPRRMFQHGLRSSGIKLRAVTILVAVTLLVRGSFIFPPAQAAVQAKGFNRYFGAVMAMWDVFALAACLVILNAGQ